MSGLMGVGLNRMDAVANRGRVRFAPVASGFSVPEDIRLETATAPDPIAAPSLLAMQEQEAEALGDREARRHGYAMLDCLTRLQQALLSGAASPESLERLARLVRAAPGPTDPRLAAVQRMVLVRVAVEIARSRCAASM